MFHICIQIWIFRYTFELTMTKKLVNSSTETLFRTSLFLLSCLPFFQLAYSSIYQQLGVNPFATLSHTTGKWAIIFLLFSIAITPSRRLLCWLFTLLRLPQGKRLSDWNFLIRARRQVGLFAAFYATLHVLTYLYLDIDWQLEYFLQDLSERKFIIVGLLAFAMTIMLALTSPKIMVKKLGRYWKRIHRLTYLLIPLSILHFYWVAKHDNDLPRVFLIVCAIILTTRLAIFLQRKFKNTRDNGLEVFRD